MASWQCDVVRITSRVARRLRGQPAAVPARVQAGVLTDLCTLYRNLLIDPSLVNDVRQAEKTQQERRNLLMQKPPGAELLLELRDHFATALRLLLEAGVDHELALEALQDAEEYLARTGQLKIVVEREILFHIQVVRRSICGIERRYLDVASAEERGRRTRSGLLAGVGLVLVGLTGAVTALTAGAAPAGAAAIGAGMTVLTGSGSAIVGAIGSTIVQNNAEALRRQA